MKKYIAPEIEIDMFSTEDIMSVSGLDYEQDGDNTNASFDLDKLLGLK